MRGTLGTLGIAVVLALAAIPTTASGAESGDVIAEGHIQAGSWTSSNTLSTASATNCAVEGVESFCFHDPPEGAVIRTETDAASSDFNVDIWFHESVDGPAGYVPFNTFIGGCSQGSFAQPGTAGDETGCTVPEGADWGTVDATWGHGLDVELVVAQPAGGSS